MLISEKAIEYLRENSIKEIRLSLFFDCSIKIKIELRKETSGQGIDFGGINVIADEDTLLFLEGLVIDVDLSNGGLIFRPE